jgi:hypothetical protein
MTLAGLIGLMGAGASCCYTLNGASKFDFFAFVKYIGIGFDFYRLKMQNSTIYLLIKNTIRQSPFDYY